jgi:hypothetical protein
MFVATVFIIAKPWNPPRCPPEDEWIMKMWNRILSIQERNDTLSFAAK